MQKTRIEVLNLQNKAIELRTINKLSYRQIADELSKRSGEKITFNVVRRFFALKEHDAVEVAAKSDKLKAKLVETEYNTLQIGIECLTDLKSVYTEAINEGDLRAAILAIGEMHRGIDIMNKTLGKYQLIQQNNQFNFNEVNLTESHEKIVSRINGIAARIGTVEDTTFIEQ